MELGELESSLLSFLSCAKAKRVLQPIEKMDGEQNWFNIWSVFHAWEEAGLELGNRLYRVFFLNWYPSKKLKYVKPRLGKSTLT